MEEALAYTEQATALSPILTPIERLRSEASSTSSSWMRFTEPEHSVHARALIANCEALLQLDSDDPDTLSACVIVSDLRGAEPARGDAICRAASRFGALATGGGSGDSRRGAGGCRWSAPVLQRAPRRAPDQAQAYQVARARQFEAHEAWVSGRPGQAFRIAERLRSEMQTLPTDARRVAGALALYSTSASWIGRSRSCRRSQPGEPQERASHRRNVPRRSDRAPRSAAAVVPEHRGSGRGCIGLPGSGDGR